VADVDQSLKELMEQVCDPSSKLNFIKRMYGSVFIEIDHVPGMDSRIRILNPMDVMTRGTQSVASTYYVDKADAHVKAWERRREVIDRLNARRPHFLEMLDSLDFSKLEQRMVDSSKAFDRLREVMPEPRGRWEGGPELTWECRGAAILEQQQEDTLRRHREARVRQSYQRRVINNRTQKRTRSPRGAGFQS